MESKLEPGDEVVCLKCDKLLMRVKSIPTAGTRDYVDCFEYIGWHGRKADKAQCECGQPFILHDNQSIIAIHIKGKGWVL